MKTKTWILLISCLLIFQPVRAQKWQEIFAQDRTQLTYLRRQVALLGTSGELAKEGYDISREGLDAIRKVKTGSYQLHQNYDQSLSTVGAVILKDSRVRGMLTLQALVLRSYGECLKIVDKYPEATWLNTYTAQVFDNLISACARDLSFLSALTREGTLSLSTEERLRQIEALYQKAEHQYEFTRHFREELALLLAHQTREASASRVMAALYADPHP